MLKTGFWRVLLAMLLILAWPAAAQAPQRLGLFAAFSDYTGRTPGWDNLPETRRDASDMRNMFDAWGYQSPAPLIDPSRQRLQDALTDLGRQIRTAPDGSLIVVYISSHGFGYRGDNFVVPSDAGAFDDVNFADKTISVSQILDKLGTRENVTRIVILDMCRNSLSKGAPAFLTGKNNQPMTAPVDRGRIPPSGTLVVYSSGYGQRSNPALGGASNSLFTEIALSMFAQKPDSFFYDVFFEVRDAVSQRTSGFQVPVFEGAARNFSLKPVALPSPRELAISAFNEAVRSRDPERLSAFIREFPEARDQIADARILLTSWTNQTTTPGRPPVPRKAPQPPERPTAAPGSGFGDGSNMAGGDVPEPASPPFPSVAQGQGPEESTAQSLVRRHSKQVVDVATTRKDTAAEDAIILAELSKRISGGHVFSGNAAYAKGAYVKKVCFPIEEISDIITCSQSGFTPTPNISYEALKRRMEDVAATSSGNHKLQIISNMVLITSISELKTSYQMRIADLERYFSMARNEVEEPRNGKYDELDIFLTYMNVALSYEEFAYFHDEFLERRFSRENLRNYYMTAWRFVGCKYEKSCQFGMRFAANLDRGWVLPEDPAAALKIYQELSPYLPEADQRHIEALSRVVNQRIYCELVRPDATSCREILKKAPIAEVR